MPIARIVGSAIIEERDIAIDAVPEHKRSLWRPVVIEGSGPTVTQTIESGRVLRVLTWTPEQTAAEIARLKGRIDADAETVRLKFISPGAGMAMTYQEKNAQAQAVFTLGEAAANALTEAERLTQFPTLSASVGVEAETLYACAELVIARYEAWATLSYAIERTRLAAKKAIGLTSTAADARAAYEAVAWPV